MEKRFKALTAFVDAMCFFVLRFVTNPSRTILRYEQKAETDL